MSGELEATSRQQNPGMFSSIWGSVTQKAKYVATEFMTECNPAGLLPSASTVKDFDIRKLIHIPYFPAFHQPGWLLYYLIGPFDADYLEKMASDLQAGFVVLLTLIPYGLSQATLANLPPVYGLYTSIIPTAVYALFGSSTALTVGPTSLISLLTGSLLTKYGVDYRADLDLAVDTAAQAAFCCGLIIAILGLLNLGNLINFMSHPVMIGFTTGAAMIIGLTQLKYAFGTTVAVPQVGAMYHGKKVEYYYTVMQWWIDNFHEKDKHGYNYTNPLAVKICFGFYVPMQVIQIIKWNYKPSTAEKKTWFYRIWNIVTATIPLVAIIVAAHIAWQIKTGPHAKDFYNSKLRIVGAVPSGLSILRVPRFRWPMGQFFADVLPLTLIAFMESYSIARKIGVATNTLNTLSASQEMFANGAANLLGCVSSSYPISGSFSRSALNAACGARSQLSCLVGLVGVIVVIRSLATSLYYIPMAVLAAVIFVAISNLLHLEDFWHMWKYSKKDLFVAITTLIFSFVFDTSIGLAVGLGVSLGVNVIFDIVLAKSHEPRLFSSSRDGADVDVVRIESDLTFLMAAKIKDFIGTLVLEVPKAPEVSNKSEYYRFQISYALDSVFKPNLLGGVTKLPKAIIIDLCIVKSFDFSGLEALEGAICEVRKKGVLVALINGSPEVREALAVFGIENDKSTAEVDFERIEKMYRVDLWTIQSTGRPRKLSFTNETVYNGVPTQENGEGFVEINLQTVTEIEDNIVIEVRRKNSEVNENLRSKVSGQRDVELVNAPNKVASIIQQTDEDIKI